MGLSTRLLSSDTSSDVCSSFSSCSSPSSFTASFDIWPFCSCTLPLLLSSTLTPELWSSSLACPSAASVGAELPAFAGAALSSGLVSEWLVPPKPGTFLTGEVLEFNEKDRFVNFNWNSRIKLQKKVKIISQK